MAGNDWQRLDFTLTPGANDNVGRFALKLKQPGSVTLGHAFLQPGEWGRFKGLPVRRDVAEGLIDQGITVLRYGGSMVNNGGYKWKKMIGPRDRRPPYAGTWYRYSSNGWGIAGLHGFLRGGGLRVRPRIQHGRDAPGHGRLHRIRQGTGRQRVGPPPRCRRPSAALSPPLHRTRQRGTRGREIRRQVRGVGQGHLGEGPGDHPGGGRFCL